MVALFCQGSIDILNLGVKLHVSFIPMFTQYLFTWLQSPTLHENITNTLRPEQFSHRFEEDLFKCVFLTENHCIFIKKFVSR